MWHLIIEKLLKAKIALLDKEIIYVHNLVRLAKLADIKLNKEQIKQLKEITTFNIEAVIDIAKKYILNLKKAGIPIQAAYLFGSAAKGKMDKNSDIDICVISPIFGKDRLDERVKLMNLQDNISDLIEPHPYSISDFNNKFDALSNEIKKYGIFIS